jgi:amino acid transporter
VKTKAAAASAGVGYKGFGAFPLRATLLLVPFMLFFNLWPNWGATLYGEVRGASDFRKNIYAMGGALLFTTVTVIITFAAMAHAMGYRFYGVLSGEYWASVTKAPTYWFPYPGMLAAMFLHNELLQVVFLTLLSLWFFGWAGSVFLSSTRVIFAAAFDRILPEWAAKVDDRTHVPVAALLLMLVPSIPISYLYAYNSNFYGYTLDATVVIAITYFGLADRQVRDRRDPARDHLRRDLRGVPGLLRVQVVLDRRVRDQPHEIARLHARALRGRARDLRRVADRAPA